jgi:hypothetical protein
MGRTQGAVPPHVVRGLNRLEIARHRA